MRVRPAVIVLLSLVLFPSLGQALALGDIELKSGLNEPFDAEIPIVSAAPEEIADLTATVASRETFARYALDRPDFLGNLRFIVDSSGSQPVMRVVSTQPIAEPFVTFLVEARWRRGRLLREYTVLLDPPVFLPTPEQTPAAAPAPVAAPRSAAAQVRPSAGRIDRTPPPRPAPPPGTYPAGAPSFDSSYGAIRRNETLWSIAERVRTDSSLTMNQTMIAIYRANPGAFLGNINLLKEGSTLRIPTRAAIEAIGRQDAFATAVAHNNAWRAGTPAQVAQSGPAPATVAAAPDSARLRLVEPDESAAAAAPGAGTGGAVDAATRETLARNANDIARLAGENEQLRADLEEIRRLLSVRDTELAELQRRAADAAATAPALAATPTEVAGGREVPPATAAGDAADTAEADRTSEPAEATAATGTSGETATTADAGPDETDSGAADSSPAPAPAIPVVTTSASDEPGLMARGVDALKSVFGSLWFYLGLGVLALAIFALVLRNRGAEETDEIEALTAQAREADTQDEATVRRQPETPSETDSATAEVEFFEDSGTFKPVDFVTEAGVSGEYPFEDTVGSEIKLDQSDPLAEADFHMAYGLYDQASELVKKAIAREPERIDLRTKLLEIFFVWGNQDEFRATAQDLHDNMSEEIGGEWDKIVIMGKQICPEDSLFAGDAGIGSGADIDLEFSPTGSQAGIDLETVSGEGDEGIDLDFGVALDEDAGVDETAGKTATDGGNTVDELLDFDLGQDLSDDADQDAGDDATRPEPVDEIKEQIRARLSDSDSEETAEMDLSDLGVDLDLEATAEGPAASGEATPDETSFDDIFGSGEVESTSELPSPTTELTAAGGGALDVDIGDVFGGLDSGDDEETARDLNALEESMEQTGPVPTDEDTGHFSAEVETLHGEALDVDIGDFGIGGDTPADDEPTGRHTEEAFSAQVFDEGDGDETRLIGPDEPTGSFDDDSFSADVFGEDETVQMQQQDDDEIVLDDGLDLDIGESLPDGEDGTTAKVAASDLALPDSGDGLSEVGTKLDLARAYMDMGDPDGARGILEEVLAEGNESQQANAREMLSSLT